MGRLPRCCRSMAMDWSTSTRSSSAEGGPALVAVQLVNNETGVIQPLDRSGDVCDAGSLLLCDCAQAAGKIALPDADFIADLAGTSSAGRRATGALLVRDLAHARAERRAGAGLPPRDREPAGAAAMAAALAGRSWRSDAAPEGARQKLERESIAAGGVVIAAARADRDHRRLCDAGRRQREPARSARPRRHLRLGGERLLVGQHEAEPGARGDGRPEEIAAAIRVSFGPSTEEPDIDRFLAEWRKIASRRKARAA